MIFHNIRYYQIIAILFFSANIIFSQENEISWEVIDENINRAFISKYLEQLENDDKLDDNEVQESHNLTVRASLSEEGIELIEIHAIDLNLDVFNLLLMDVVKKLDDGLRTQLISRKYAWDDINVIDYDVEDPTDIKNPFKERNFKQCRDAFWWSQNEFDISLLSLRWIIRGKYSGIGISVEPGFEEGGYPLGLSNIINLGVSSEVTKVFITIPREPLFNIGINQPLAGAWGGGIKFDTYKFGGMVSYQDISWTKQGDLIKNKDDVYYNNWAGHLYWSSTWYINPRIKKIKLRSEPGVKERTAWPSGSFRLKVGAMYLKIIQGEIVDNKFDQKSQSTSLGSVQFTLRGEYFTDADEDEINRWKLAAQLNYGLTSQIGFQTQISYNIYKFLQFELITAYVSKLEFEDERDWNPGFIVFPSIALKF